MVMVVQMMGGSSVALRKTNKKLELQNEAMEFKEQFSDIIMQADYIRVQSKDNVTYTLDTSLDANNNRKRTKNSSGTLSGDLVSDNYPNYLKAGDSKLDIYINKADYTLYGKDKKDNNGVTNKYPNAVDNTIQSLRILTNGVNGGDPYYIIPEYIYVRYQFDAHDLDNKDDDTEKYAIYHFISDNNTYKVVADKGTLNDVYHMTNDGYAEAKGKVNGKKDYDGLVSKNVKDVYLSADTNANTIYVDMVFEMAKYLGQTYNYYDAIVLRNTYAMTGSPNRVYYINNTTP